MWLLVAAEADPGAVRVEKRSERRSNSGYLEHAEDALLYSLGIRLS